MLKADFGGIPLRKISVAELAGSAEIEKLCRKENGPVCIEVNGSPGFVLMSIESYNKITENTPSNAELPIYESIQEKSGMKPGKVYIYNRKTAETNRKFESPQRYNSEPIGSALYDSDTGNFHIVPEKYKEHLSKITSVRDAVFDELALQKDKCGFERLFKGKGGKGALQIEKYVGVEHSGYTYLLCFERLYTHKKTVNCLLGLFQFYKYPRADRNINTVKRKTKERKTVFTEICYPNSFKDGKIKTVISENGTEKRGHTVYNPTGLSSVFETENNKKAVSDVCRAFIGFINEDNETG